METLFEKVAMCSLCGEPMPPGETMFKFHGYSGPCPKPPLPRAPDPETTELARLRARVAELEVECSNMRGWLNSIASWHEGQDVNNTFDEPNSASRARFALRGLPCPTT